LSIIVEDHPHPDQTTRRTDRRTSRPSEAAGSEREPLDAEVNSGRRTCARPLLTAIPPCASTRLLRRRARTVASTVGRAASGRRGLALSHAESRDATSAKCGDRSADGSYGARVRSSASAPPKPNAELARSGDGQICLTRTDRFTTVAAGRLPPSLLDTKRWPCDPPTSSGA
jgi:hypothetical protein